MKRGLFLGLMGSGAAILILGGLVAGCAPDRSAPELQPRTDRPRIEEPESAAYNLPTAGAWLEPFSDQSCLDCHSNQDQLAELAKAD
ncbi:MAG TPA: hypothetical protein VJZ27_03270, partial [Aggregatilineales bacterium]|nr:hypothetical protein [Aggregatilineales bacterium]